MGNLSSYTHTHIITKFNIGGNMAEILPSKKLKSKREASKQRISPKPNHNSEEDARPQEVKKHNSNPVITTYNTDISFQIDSYALWSFKRPYGRVS